MNKKIFGVIAGLVVTAVIGYAQDGKGMDDVEPNASYDGRYAFARLRYTVPENSPCTCQVRDSKGPEGWQHDYPNGDRQIMKIMTGLTSLNARVDSGVVLTTDDPKLAKYPILYLTEPACWHPSDAEVLGLRNYLLKGGLLIVDDFSICFGGQDRYELSRQVFEAQIKRILPEGKITRVDMANPVLNGFFRLDTLKIQESLSFFSVDPPQIQGIYERNDPNRRLMVIANYNTAVHRFWEWQDEGIAPIESTNEAYKLTVNYLMYGFTH